MERPARVLRIIARLNVGGPARHVVWLTEGLRPAFETMLVTGVVPEGEQDMSGFAIDRGVSPVVVESMSREISPRDLVTIWRVWRLMVRFQPDIVHTHTAKAGTVGRLAGWLYRYVTPRLLVGNPRRAFFVHTYHGHVLHGYYGTLKSRLFAAIERVLAWLNTDRIVVLGSQQLAEIHGRFRIGRADQFSVIPLGIDLSGLRIDIEARASIRSELAIPNDAPVVGIVGRVTPIKNHELFLRVAELVGKAARFVVFGDGETRPQLESRGGAVRFAGTRTANEIYSCLDVVALTSRNEGTPLALIEAMAVGRPVVSTAVGGVVDLLGRVEEHVIVGNVSYEVRERGLTAPSGDAESFAAALLRLLGDEALRDRLAERGKAYATANHSLERLLGAIIHLYQDLQSPSGRRSRGER